MCILRCELLEAVQVDHNVFLIVMTCFLQTQVSCTGCLAQDVHSFLALCNKGVGNPLRGARVYAQTALAHAHAVADQLHNAAACPIEQTRLLFSTHANADGPRAPL
jgi:hypothetical protein